MAVGRGDAEAEHEGQLGRSAPGFFDGDAGILHVEDGLYEQGVDTAFDKGLNLFGIGLAQHVLVEKFAAGSDTGRTTRGTNASCHKAGLLRGGIFVSTLAGQTGCCQVDVATAVLQAIVLQGDALRIEGVGLNNICTGGEVFAMDIANNEGSRERQYVVAALQVEGVAGETGAAEVFLAQLVLLNHGPHGTVEDENFIEMRGER